MPILFKCHACHRKLSVSSEKAGREVQCPRCGVVIPIPTREDMDTMAAMAQTTGEPLPERYAAFRFADQPAAARSDTQHANADRTATPAAAGGERLLGRGETISQPIDLERVSLPRTVIYVQGALIGIVAVTAFVGGYFYGYQSSPTRESTVQTVPGKAQAATVSGVLKIQSQQQTRPDPGGVVLLLPRDRVPDDSIPVQNLGPGSPADGNSMAVGALESIGGAWQPADDEGRFEMQVPPGPYYVLYVSHRAPRSPRHLQPVDELELMRRYFDKPQALLAGHAYAWKSVELEAKRDLSHTFTAEE